VKRFQVLHSRVCSWRHPQTLGKAEKACQGQMLQLTMKRHNLGCKKFYNIDTWNGFVLFPLFDVDVIVSETKNAIS
jgi:hypothetical protein